MKQIFSQKWDVQDHDQGLGLGQGHEVGEEGVVVVTAGVGVAVLLQIHTGRTTISVNTHYRSTLCDFQVLKLTESPV